MTPAPPADGVNLFLTQTQYHMLMATGFATKLRREGATSRLLAIDDFWHAGDFFAALEEWPGNPFSQVVNLGKYERESGRDAKKGSVRALMERIYTQIGETPVRAFYLFNDRNGFAQYALQEMARRHPAAARIAIEDGTAAYAMHGYRRYSGWRLILNRWRYGWRWSNVELAGTHPLVQRFIGHYPQLFRPELSRVPVERYPTEILNELPLGQFAGLLARRLGIDTGPWQGVQLVMPVPSSGYFVRKTPEYPKRARTLLRELAHAGLRVGIKYHPREQERDFIGSAEFPNVVELPRGVPFEFVCVMLDARPRLVVGDISTAIMLANKMNPQLRPVTYRHGPGFHDYNLTAQFEKLGIPSVASAAELVALARTLGAPDGAA